MPKIHEGPVRTEGRRFAVVASRWNDFVVDKLLEGALAALRQAGAADEDVELFRCPGAFEIPALSRRVLATRRFDGLVCLGTVIRGATPHFDLVVRETAAGVARLAEDLKIAVGFGVLACENIEQAMERAGGKVGNRGADAALVAVEMASLYAALDEPVRPAVRTKEGPTRRSSAR
jgi:6,7-dimethyl-8-ribityllumazine synthase